jgi:hypothetical protein
MFDRVGPYSPFILVGGLDLLFAVCATLCAFCGILRNDILDKEVKRRLDAGE